MRIPILLSLALTFLTQLASAAQPDRTIDVFAWPLSASKSQTLARISYNTTTATLKSYNPPLIPADDRIVRIGFNHGTSDGWSGIATSASNFAEGKYKTLQLLLNAQGEVYHVGFSASDLGSSSASGSGKDGLIMEVVPMKVGPLVHLNKPVVLNAQGTLDDKEPEKTFLQK
jgi:hypothetical protein